MRFYIVLAMIFLCGTAHAYHLKTKTISENGTVPRFSVMAQYPVIKGLHANNAGALLNEHIAKWILDRITQFRQDLTSVDPGAESDLPGDNRISINYSVKIKAAHVLGLSWDVYPSKTRPLWGRSYSDFSGLNSGACSRVFDQETMGSAHPSEVLLPMMFNLDTGAQITLADIFKPGSNYLKVLSQYCTQQLAEKLADSGYLLFEDGLKPITPNFSNFLIRPEGLSFLFNPYQVAPYVAGMQEVVVPYSMVAGLLLPGGPVAEIQVSNSN